MKWTYHIAIVNLNPTQGQPPATDALDELGKEGWEAVSALPNDAAGVGYASILFKKSQ